MLTTICKWLGFKREAKAILKPSPKSPTIIKRASHNISRRDISKLALKVLYRLHESGFQAFLVGGGVRDVLLGFHPKDFDVATNARPEQVSALFRNSRLIGRRFRLVHVHFGGHIVEVATFRAEHPREISVDPSVAHLREDGMIVRDNIYGSLEEDVWRRDFTVNALYYNIADFTLIDYVGGMEDLKNATIRLIGDPETRYREDPLRMLRALRFAAKLNFTLHKETEKPLEELAPLLANVPAARLFDEYLKLFLSGHALLSFELLRKYKLFSILFPMTAEILNSKMKYGAEKNTLTEQEKSTLTEKNKRNTLQISEDQAIFEVLALTEPFIILALKNTDQRIQEEKGVAPPFLLAVFLWYPVCQEANILMKEENMTETRAFFSAFSLVLQEQRKAFAIPRRISQTIHDIWSLQFRLERRKGKRAFQLFAHTKFRAAYDFLLLRYRSGDKKVEALLKWWTEFIEANDEDRTALANAIKGKRKKTKRKIR